MKAVGLSLWLVLPREIERRLAARIAELAHRWGTPAFDPHLTLLAGLRIEPALVLSRSQELASRLPPVEIRLGSVAAEDDFFRSIVLRADMTPTLQMARSVVEGAFPSRSEAPFEPHLSLLYGTLDRQLKAPLLTDLTVELPIVSRAICLDVVQTEGEVVTWRRLERYPLEGNE